MSKLEKLEALKTDIRSLLVSRNSKDITLPYLNKLYKDITDEDIPYTDFNYTSLRQFLLSIPEILNLETNEKNELCAYHVDTEKSKHISILVSKEKKNTMSQRRKSNLIDPSILNDILLELFNNSVAPPGQNKRIKKSDVLSSITNQIGEYAFYSAQDLNNQLSGLTHLLYYNDKYIYLKNEIYEHRDKNKANNNMNDSHLLNGLDKQIGGFTKNSSVSDLIRQSTKDRLRNLVQKYSNGIWCAELPKLYQREFKIDLEYGDLGFNSILEFVGALPEIFQIMKSSDNRKYYVLDSKIQVDNHNHQTLNLSRENKFQEHSDSVGALPASLQSTCVIQSLMPDGVLYNERIKQIDITSLLANFQNDLDIIVSEVHNPSFFWVHLRENKKILHALSKHLQTFYTSQDLFMYRIPPILIKPGVHVACLFDNLWHRGIIKQINPEGPMIHFYDYGTNEIYSSKDLYFLNKQFSVIPAQAIPCSLHNVKPVGANKWSRDVNSKFTKRVFDKPFVSYISSIDHERNFMVIDLVDASNYLIDVNINNWMVESKIAEWVTPVIVKSLSSKNDCNQYMQKLSLRSSLNNANHKEEMDTKHNINIENLKTLESSSTSDISFESNELSKKLQILRKYKSKYLNNSKGC